MGESARFERHDFPERDGRNRFGEGQFSHRRDRFDRPPHSDTDPARWPQAPRDAPLPRRDEYARRRSSPIRGPVLSDKHGHYGRRDMTPPHASTRERPSAYDRDRRAESDLVHERQSRSEPRNRAEPHEREYRSGFSSGASRGAERYPPSERGPYRRAEPDGRRDFSVDDRRAHYARPDSSRDAAWARDRHARDGRSPPERRPGPQDERRASFESSARRTSSDPRDGWARAPDESSHRDRYRGDEYGQEPRSRRNEPSEFDPRNYPSHERGPMSRSDHDYPDRETERHRALPEDGPARKRPKYGDGSPRKMRKMFVTNLDFGLTEEGVREMLFRMCGVRVHHVQNLRPSPAAGPSARNNGMAIVRLPAADTGDVQKLMECDHMEYKGRPVLVVDETERTVCVRGLATSVQQQEVAAMFRGCKIVNVRKTIRPPRSSSDPESVVWFVDMADYDSVLRAVQTQSHLRNVLVTFAASRRPPTEGSDRRPVRAQGLRRSDDREGGFASHGNQTSGPYRDSEYARPNGFPSRDMFPEGGRGEDTRRASYPDGPRDRRGEPGGPASRTNRRDGGPGMSDTPFAERDRVSRETILDAVDAFYRHGFDPRRACIIGNLPFLGRHDDRRRREDEVHACAERVIGPSQISRILLLGRRAGSAVVTTRDEAGLDTLARNKVLIFDGRPAHVKTFGREIVFALKNFGPDYVDRLRELCVSSAIVPLPSETEMQLCAVRDSSLTVLKLLALDGHQDGARYVNVSVWRDAKDVRDQAEALGLTHDGRRGNAEPVPKYDRDGRPLWEVRIENAPFGTLPEDLSRRVREAGARGEIRVSGGRSGGTFGVIGSDPADFRATMSVSGMEIGPERNRRVLRTQAITEPGRDRGDEREAGAAQAHSGARSPASRVRSPTGPDDRYSRYRESPEFVDGDGAVRGSRPNAHQADALELTPSGGRSKVRLREDHQDERTRDGGHRSSRSLDEPNTASPASSKRPQTADLSGASRGFRASPLTPSPADFVSTIRKPKKRKIDPSLPNITDRVDRMHDDILRGAASPKHEGTYESFCNTIASLCRPQKLVHTLRNDDTPHAPHVWQGSTTMGKADRATDALCNGYLVVKQDQTDDMVRETLELMPRELTVEYRTPWDDDKFAHLIREDAVVLMVRSAGDEPPPEGAERDRAVRRPALSALDSHRALLGILRNLRDKQRIGVVRYSKPDVSDRKLAALCIPPSANAFEKLGVPWRFRDMAGHDTLLVVAGLPKSTAKQSAR